MPERGYYGRFGGAFIPEILVATFEELVEVFDAARADPAFWDGYVDLMSTYSGRPTPITFAANLSEHFGGARIYVKREDLNHTGAHKANNVMGQGLLVRRMGKTRVIAETGAGQHGVATATMAAKFGLECTIYMGEVDIERQRPNVFWMERLGATVVPVTSGSRTLTDAINEAFRDWVAAMDTTHYVLGTACGPHPFPQMVTYFQSIIGKEAHGQMRETHSVAAGLDYVGVSPILSDLHERGRVRVEAATDREVVDALALTLRKEGLVPALESSHAFVQAFKEAPEMSEDEVILIDDGVAAVGPFVASLRA